MTVTAGAATAAGEARPVVVIGCGARKAPGPAVAEALYTGPYFRACLSAALSLTTRDRVLVLSARHGLLRLDDGPIAPHDLRMGDPGAVTASEVSAQARALGLAGEAVVALCGARYAAVVAQVWPRTRTPLAGLGIGRQLHQLARIRAGHSLGEPPAGGRP